MKQFSLKEYSRRVAEGETPEIVTRDGCTARIICTDYKCNHYPVISLILLNGREEMICMHKEDGSLYKDCNNKYDLFFAPCKKTIKGWVNVYMRGFGTIRDSEEDAELYKQEGCIKTIEISTEIEEE